MTIPPTINNAESTEENASSRVTNVNYYRLSMKVITLYRFIALQVISGEYCCKMNLRVRFHISFSFK